MLCCVVSICFDLFCFGVNVRFVWLCLCCFRCVVLCCVVLFCHVLVWCVCYVCVSVSVMLLCCRVSCCVVLCLVLLYVLKSCMSRLCDCVCVV